VFCAFVLARVCALCRVMVLLYHISCFFLFIVYDACGLCGYFLGFSVFSYVLVGGFI